jgi:hypothetical protein
MRGRQRIDPLARRAVLGIAAGRIAIGAGALLATGPALKALGFAEADTATRSLARIAAGRDIAIGLLTVTARDDARALRLTALLAAAVDGTDAISFAVAARDPEAHRAGLVGSASGAAAALTGAWAYRRLSP